MTTRNVSLPAELEDYINAKVASGEYAHASEVVRDGVRLLMKREAEKLDWLRSAITEGLADLEAGRIVRSGKLLEEVEKGGRALLDARRKRAG